MIYGYQIAEAIEDQYHLWNGANKDEAVDALAILIELNDLSNDKWIQRLINNIKTEYGVNENDIWV